MTDIATLGLKIDSSQATGAAKALDGLTAAAKPAAVATTALDKAAEEAAKSTSALDNATRSANKSLKETSEAAKPAAVSVAATATAVSALNTAATPAASGINAATAATNALTKAATPAATAAANLSKGTVLVGSGAGLARHEMINLSRQIQDVGVSLASGQSPFMVLAQQGTQIADIFGSSKTGSVGGALKQIGSGIYGFLGPVGLATAAIGGIAAATYLAVSSVANMGKAFDDVARSAGAARGELHGLQQVASNKGISNDDFSKAIGKWGDDIYRAKNGMGGLAEVMRANSKSAKDFNGYLENAADLIKNAKDDQTRLQLLQQMGLPATMQWVRFLSQGKDGIRAATEEAVRFNETAEGKMIAAARRFDEAWDTTTTRWVNRFKSGAIEVGGALSGITIPEWMKNFASGAASNVLGGPIAMIAGGMGRAVMGKPADPGQALLTGSQGLKRSDYEWGGPKETVDPAVAQKRISDRQTYLGLLGQTISAEQAAQQIQLQADATYLSTGVAVSQSKIDQLKKLAVEQTLGITGIKSAADAWRVESETVGMSIGAATQYATAQNAINAARIAGRTLSADNIAAINAEASALGQAAQHADNMRFGYENLVRGPMQAFRSAISQGATAWDAFRKAGSSALDSIATKLMDMAAQNLWKSAFGGGGGGLLSLFGLGGGTSAASAVAGGIAPVMHTGYGPGDATASRYIHPAYFDNAPRYHNGIGPGEQAAIIRKDESVLTPGQMKALGNGRGGTPAVTIVQHNIFTNADPGSEARMRQWAAQTKDMAVKEAVQAVANVKGTSPSYMKASR